MLRERRSAALPAAAKEGEQRAAGAADGPGENAITATLRDKVDQRKRAIARCGSSARLDQAEQKAEGIGVIERFPPRPMTEAEVMAASKARLVGRMDFNGARRLLCRRLH